MTGTADPAAALVDALEGGAVDFDGLCAAREGGEFVLTRGGDTEAFPTAAALREAAQGDPYVRNWYHWEREVGGRGTARRAFLRWLERADERAVPERVRALRDGVAREWGQLLVSVALDDGERVYGVRHEADAGSDTDDLTLYDDPLDAREVVTFDDGGRYRPLKTAPTLPTGWAFEGLDGADAVRTVDFVYPATVANWHREREGDLDVTHYRETAERQTGIYDLIDELPVAGVENLARACCADDACVKRREWDEDADTELDSPRGDGVFPCREPCSLVVSAARRFTILEGETPREYTFELTPSEKEQLEGLLDAVADGRVDEVRAADLGDGANRYRARYLRAKRLTDRGLDDVPTFPEDDA